jgi:hypothetical protein
MAEENKELNTGAGFGGAFSNVDFAWNEDGEIDLIDLGVNTEGEGDVGSLEETTEVSESEDSTGAAEEGAGGEADIEGDTTGDEPKGNPNSEVEALKSELAALKESLKTKDKTPDDQVGPLPTQTVEALVPEDKDIVDMLSDRETGIKFIKDSFNAQISPLIDSLRPMVIQWRIHQEALAITQKHGEEFTKRLPLIQTLVQKRPDLTMQQAFDLVKDVPVVAKSPAKTGQGEARDGKATPTTESVAAAAAEAKAIAEKANKLRTEQGVAGTHETGPADTIRQALSDAVEEHYSNQ